MFAHPSRFRTRWTCTAEHAPLPRAVGMPCSFRPAAIVFATFHLCELVDNLPVAAVQVSFHGLALGVETEPALAVPTR
jgi:hypothetical protein